MFSSIHDDRYAVVGKFFGSAFTSAAGLKSFPVFRRLGDVLRLSVGATVRPRQPGSLESCPAIAATRLNNLKQRHVSLLPFGNGKDKQGRPNAQLIIGYRGMIDLARRSGQIVSLSAYCVHEQDTFNYKLGLDPDIEHIPASVADRGKVTHVYAVAKLKGGGVQFEVLSRAEIEAIRSTSKAGNSGPWKDHWEEMAKKSAIRRLFKYLPVSIEAVRAVEIDEKSDRGEAVTQQDFIEGEFIEKGTAAEQYLEGPVVDDEVHENN